MGDPLRPEYDPVDALARELKLVKAQNLALQKQCHVMEEQRDRARGLQKSAEEMSAARALEIDRLKTALGGFAEEAASKIKNLEDSLRTYVEISDENKVRIAELVNQVCKPA